MPGVFEPTTPTALQDARSELQSEVRQLLSTIDARDRTAEPYFRAAVGDLGERAADLREELLNRPVAADGASDQTALVEAADTLANAADELARQHGDPVAVGQLRATIDHVGGSLGSSGQ